LRMSDRYKDSDQAIRITNTECWDISQLVRKYPLKNKTEWNILKKDSDFFLIAYCENPQFDPWDRKMKNWTCGGVYVSPTEPISSFNWTEPSSNLPPANDLPKNCLTYTTVGEKLVKLWRSIPSGV